MRLMKFKYCVQCNISIFCCWLFKAISLVKFKAIIALTHYLKSCFQACLLSFWHLLSESNHYVARGQTTSIEFLKIFNLCYFQLLMNVFVFVHYSILHVHATPPYYFYFWCHTFLACCSIELSFLLNEEFYVHATSLEHFSFHPSCSKSMSNIVVKLPFPYRLILVIRNSYCSGAFILSCFNVYMSNDPLSLSSFFGIMCLNCDLSLCIA